MAESKSKILVLHSYHQNLEWSDKISQGIESVFSAYEDQYEIHYDFLDTKRHTGSDYFEKLVQFLAYKYASREYKAIIASDNNALKMLNDGDITFHNNPPIIFTGINNFNPSLVTKLSNVTGVIERVDHRANIELIRNLHPNHKQITVIVDRTPTGNAIFAQLQSLEKELNDTQLSYYRDFTFKELEEYLSGLEDGMPIYLLTINRDREQQFFSSVEGIDMVRRNAKGPIYGAWDFYMGRGMVGGKLVSGFLQGEQAATMALDVLQNPASLSEGVVRSVPTVYMFDYRLLNEFDIDLNNLPANSQILYKPKPLHEQYKEWLMAVTLVTLIACCLLVWKDRRQKLLLKERLERSRKLEEMVLERTLELEKINKKLQKLSSHDDLTKLYNRRFFDQALTMEINRCQRDGTAISLLMCDIDLFKKFNDTYGHLAGDNCIRVVAQAIKENCKRGSDVPARYGGEEFSAILPNTGEEGALAVANNIQHSLADKAVPFEGSELVGQVTMSIGAVTLRPKTYTSAESIIDMADQALYASKHHGRNCITVFEK